MEHCDLLVVGAGAAGMAAAHAARTAGAGRVLLADREDTLGGVLPQCVHRGFGLAWFHAPLTGPEYAARLSRQLEGSGVELRLNTAVLEVSPRRQALLSGPEGIAPVAFRHLLLATGCREIPLGALPVTGTRPAGVYTAGQVQRMIDRLGWSPGRRAVVLGSGDVGLIVARRLVQTGCQVAAVVERRDTCGGLARNFRACLEAFRIPLLTGATVTQVHGAGRVSAVSVTLLGRDRTQRIPCDTLVTALGMVPERDLLRPLGEPLPPWVSLCGNCLRVHTSVDAVTLQARDVGRALGEALRAGRSAP